MIVTKDDVAGRISSLLMREAKCWAFAEVCMENRDPHGLHDMGVEIEALRRTRIELEKLLDLTR